MTVDESGFVQWTPMAAQAGDHEVVLKFTKEIYLGFDQNARILDDRQRFVITVLPADNLDGLEPHPYVFMSHPPLLTRDQTQYVYEPSLYSQDDNWTLQLVSGPDGMAVTTDRKVSWNVPEESTGSFVTLRATTSDGVDVYQSYFLHVALDWNELPQKLRMAHAELGAGMPFLNWVGEDTTYWIQRKSGLGDSTWQTIAGPLSATSPNVFTDEQAAANGNYFYRIVEGAEP